ncbi:MAG TPA: TetR family transcriptional regulator [Streptosporangiaceae bacterium]|nr:TetR family transcriptional regulator [Streptosporangiaceae bacterium]
MVERSLTEPDGLRERKKAATRRALGLAAMRLAIERGLDNVLVEDIAAAADVSTRTFNNYFASKYEAICSLAMERGQFIGAQLRARPATESLMDAITNAVIAPYEHGNQVPDKAHIEGIRLVIKSPALQGEFLRTQYATQQELAAAIADRIGSDPAEMFPRVMAGAVTAATHVALEHWLSADPPTALVPLLKEALGQLRCPLAPDVTPIANTPQANSIALIVRPAHADLGQATTSAPPADPQPTHAAAPLHPLSAP